MHVIQLRFARLAASVASALALGAGCGEADSPEPSTTPVTSTPGQVNAGAPSSNGTSTPAAPSATPSTAQPTDAGTSSTAPSTPSAGTDSLWCKAKAVIDKNCVACHKTPAAAGAPFPLTTFAELTAAHPSKPGKKVYERVAVRIHADQSQRENLIVMPSGKQMAAADLAAIDAWVAAGAPAGANPTCPSAAGDAGTPVAETWPLKECDAVYTITSHGPGGKETPNTAPPGRESHPQVAWDAPWGSEQVQAIAFKSITDNAAILHHWILSARPGGFIFGWAPGEEEIQKMPEDVGMLMPTGTGSLNLDMHYYNTEGTKTEQDKSGVEVCVVKKERFRKHNAGVATRLAPLRISIPPNAVNHEAKSSCTISGTTPITLLNASPHAHKLAVRMIFTVTKKNGQVIPMHDMPFVFGEQGTYPLDPPVVVEAGDVINTTCIFTNKTNQTVTFGESTNNEMCFNFALYYPAGALTCGAAAAGTGGFFGL